MDWRNSVRAFMYIRTAKDEEDKSIRELEVMKINSGRTGEIKKLYYEDGCFVIHDEGQENFLQAVKINAAEVTYVDCLAICTKRSQNVSSSIGPNYAPKVFSSMREANNYSSILLAKAQDSLFKNGTIHMVEYGPPSKIRFKIELKAKW
jgi:hypothetical protein